MTCFKNKKMFLKARKKLMKEGNLTNMLLYQDSIENDRE